MPDEYRLRLKYTEPMLRKAVRVYVWRRLLRRPWLWLAELALLAIGVALEWNQGPSYITGLALACALFLAVSVAVLWRAHFNNTVGRFRTMDPPFAEAVFGATGMTVSSNRGSSTLPWSTFVDYWELDVAWLLFPGPNQFLTLPIEALTPDVQDFLRSKLRNRS